jgi:hypothetical protein
LLASLSRLADKNLIAIARDDDTFFEILHSRFHESRSLRLGTSLEDRPRYTPTQYSRPSISGSMTPNALAQFG